MSSPSLPLSDHFNYFRLPYKLLRTHRFSSTPSSSNLNRIQWDVYGPEFWATYIGATIPRALFRANKAEVKYVNGVLVLDIPSTSLIFGNEISNLISAPQISPFNISSGSRPIPILSQYPHFIHSTEPLFRPACELPTFDQNLNPPARQCTTSESAPSLELNGKLPPPSTQSFPAPQFQPVSNCPVSHDPNMSSVLRSPLFECLQKGYQQKLHFAYINDCAEIHSAFDDIKSAARALSRATSRMCITASREIKARFRMRLVCTRKVSVGDGSDIQQCPFKVNVHFNEQTQCVQVSDSSLVHLCAPLTSEELSKYPARPKRKLIAACEHLVINDPRISVKALVGHVHASIPSAPVVGFESEACQRMRRVKKFILEGLEKDAMTSFGEFPSLLKRFDEDTRHELILDDAGEYVSVAVCLGAARRIFQSGYLRRLFSIDACHCKSKSKGVYWLFSYRFILLLDDN